MVRKTITIHDDVFHHLEASHITSQYNSFSEMVSSALELLIEKQKKDAYKKAMLEASKDRLYIQDMQEVQSDFEYADFEVNR